MLKLINKIPKGFLKEIVGAVSFFFCFDQYGLSLFFIGLFF